MIYNSPFGNITVIDDGSAVTNIYFGMGRAEKTPVSALCCKQLDEYFSGKRKIFEIPLNPKGTEFQRKVWEELLKIPYGETLSYSDIARKIQNPKACRAVGMANNKNPIPILIPCHRVIGKNGNLTGYASGLAIKQGLIEFEKSNLSSLGNITVQK